MDIDLIKIFLKWCSIVNGIIIFFSLLMFSFFSDSSYNNNKKLFADSKIRFKRTIYTILLYYIMIVLIFNLVPYFVLMFI